MQQKDVAARLGVRPGTVLTWVKKYRPELRTGIGFSQDKVNEALDLFEGGMRQRDIAERLGIDQTTISRWVKKYRPELGRKYGDEVISEALRLYDSGASQGSVARQLGVSRKTVFRWLKMREEDPEPASSPDPELEPDDGEFLDDVPLPEDALFGLDLLDQGWSLSDVADELSVEPSVVRGWQARYRLNPSSSSELKKKLMR